MSVLSCQSVCSWNAPNFSHGKLIPLTLINLFSIIHSLAVPSIRQSPHNFMVTAVLAAIDNARCLLWSLVGVRVSLRQLSLSIYLFIYTCDVTKSKYIIENEQIVCQIHNLLRHTHEAHYQFFIFFYFLKIARNVHRHLTETSGLGSHRMKKDHVP